MIMGLIQAIWTTIVASGILYGLGLSAFVLAHFLAGEQWRWVAFGNNFIPWWALGGALFIAISLWSRQRWMVIVPQLPAVLLFLMLYGERFMPRNELALASNSPGLTAATFNILASESDPEQITATIKHLDADIIGLQELNHNHAATFDRTLTGQYPYRELHPLPSFHGVGLLSRYPITQSEVFLPLPDSMRYLRAEIAVDGVPIVVYVVHPPPPDQAMLPWRYDSARRDEELRILRENYLAAEQGPVIVVGDFNMTDQSRAYKAMRTLLGDSFRDAGRGLGLTWPAETANLRGRAPRAIRIDYVWYSDHFDALSARVAPSSGTSDHRPVVATLRLDVSVSERTSAPTWEAQ